MTAATAAAALCGDLAVGGTVAGHLRLVCDLDPRGRTRLREQSFSAPVHLSKPHWDGATLVLNIANPTPGFLAGDRLSVEVELERRARLLLTAPSANRVHAMPNGQRAEVRQQFRIAAGACLDVWPELLIAQGGARYFQQTLIRLEPGAELLFFERLAPGRTASGEIFAHSELRLDLDLFVGQRLLLRERSRLTPGSPLLASLCRQFPTPYYASAVLVSPALTPLSACWQTLHEQHRDEAWVGVSSIDEHAFVLRIVAGNSIALRRILNFARAAVYECLRRGAPDLRRT